MKIRIDGYEAEIVYEEALDTFAGFIWSGEGLAPGDLVHFLGRSLDELRQEARVSIECHRETRMRALREASG